MSAVPRNCSINIRTVLGIFLFEFCISPSVSYLINHIFLSATSVLCISWLLYQKLHLFNFLTCCGLLTICFHDTEQMYINYLFKHHLHRAQATSMLVKIKYIRRQIHNTRERNTTDNVVIHYSVRIKLLRVSRLIAFRDSASYQTAVPTASIFLVIVIMLLVLVLVLRRVTANPCIWCLSLDIWRYSLFHRDFSNVHLCLLNVLSMPRRMVYFESSWT